VPRGYHVGRSCVATLCPLRGVLLNEINTPRRSLSYAGQAIKIELLVLVARREWYTRSHSEHGS